MSTHAGELPTTTAPDPPDSFVMPPHRLNKSEEKMRQVLGIIARGATLQVLHTIVVL